MRGIPYDGCQDEQSASCCAGNLEEICAQRTNNDNPELAVKRALVTKLAQESRQIQEAGYLVSGVSQAMMVMHRANQVYASMASIQCATDSTDRFVQQGITRIIKMVC